MRLFWLMLIALVAAGSSFCARAESEEPPRTVAEPIPDEAPAPVKVARKKDPPPAAEPAAAPPAPAEPVAEEVDLIADKPEAAEKKKPDLLDAMEPAGPLGETASNVYKIITDMKTNMDLIAKDLDGGGKEVTRLLRTSDNVSKNATDLSKVWMEDQKFRDMCGSAKRAVLMLNDELSREPRHWSHVRWAYNDAVKEVRKLRITARELAEFEPKPEARVGKDGKIIYVEPAGPVVDPKIAERNAKIQEVNEAKARLKRAEEGKKNARMPMSLDDEK
jgi:hypothetical protein